MLAGNIELSSSIQPIRTAAGSHTIHRGAAAITPPTAPPEMTAVR